MKRILILGCCGAGKTSLARQLHSITQIPIIHLDQEYWRPNWIETPKEEWIGIVEELANRETWIMDGNFSSTFHLRIPRADTIIYLDRSTPTCLWRVCKRIFTYYRKVRPDMGAGCPERFDFEFLQYVLTFNRRERKKLLRVVETSKDSKRTFVFQNDEEINAFLANSAGG